jgi:hypothetical protein
LHQNHGAEPSNQEWTVRKLTYVAMAVVSVALGLTNVAQGAGSSDATPTDPLAGRISAAAIAGPEQPIPLPNPAVFQAAAQPARSDTVTITLAPGGKTEVKAVMLVNKVITYTWKADQGVVYVDFHGHSPDWTNKKAFVRYLEAKDGVAADSGSLVAPFSGEHGWYWVNKQDRTATITLTVTGYHESVKSYGAL